MARAIEFFTLHSSFITASAFFYLFTFLLFYLSSVDRHQQHQHDNKDDC